MPLVGAIAEVELVKSRVEVWTGDGEAVLSEVDVGWRRLYELVLSKTRWLRERTCEQGEEMERRPEKRRLRNIYGREEVEVHANAMKL